LLGFLNTVVTAIVRLAVKPQRYAAIESNAGRAKGGALGWRLSVRQEKNHLVVRKNSLKHFRKS